LNPNSSKGQDRDFPAWIFLAATLVLFYPFLLEGSSRVFLGIDLGVIFYPLFHWAVSLIRSGHLPLVTDLSLHGAPLSAISPVGLLSPLPYLPFLFLPFDAAFNVMVVFPNALFLFGSYHAGRSLGLSRSASILMACLWTYNGTSLAQTDRLLSWGCVTFPWAFWALQRRKGSLRRSAWLFIASVLWGFCVLSGHLTMVLFQGCFFTCWLLLDPAESCKQRFLDLGALTLGALVLAAPRLLYTTDCLSFDPAQKIAWGETDRFFHSWWPVNIVTLFFPWFFGKFQYDYQNDFWWQYHFNETQAALSIGALFFIAVFFRRKHPYRLALLAAALFGLAMALGRFSPVYRLAQHLPVFSLFRDPARWWYLTSWALGLSAAFGWDRWFQSSLTAEDRKMAWTLALLPPFLLASLALALGPLRHLLDHFAIWTIKTFLLGDPLHRLPLASYQIRISEKAALLSRSINLTRWEVYLPVLLALSTLLLVLFHRPDRRKPLQVFWLLVILLDLWAFKMPYGLSVLPSSTFQAPPFAVTADRLLSTTPVNNAPYDPTYRSRLAFPNTNLLFGQPSLTFHLGKSVPRYEDIDREIGWFGWVYKERPLEGWKHHPILLRTYGINRVASDGPPPIPSPFTVQRASLPFLYGLEGKAPRAFRASRLLVFPWPSALGLIETDGFNPSQDAFLDSPPLFPFSQGKSGVTIETWCDLEVSCRLTGEAANLLVLQKTFLPSWKAYLDGRKVPTLRCDGVLLGVPVPSGDHRLTLEFRPIGLQLGFFLSLLFLAATVSICVQSRKPT